MSAVAIPCPHCAYEHVVPRTGKPSCAGHHLKRRDRAGGRRPCLNYALPGLTTCRAHGKDTEQARARGKAAARAQAMRDKVVRAGSVYGLPREIDPAIGLIEEYWRTAGIVARLELLVAEIPEDEIHWGRVKETVKVTPGATLVVGLGRDETGTTNIDDVGTGPSVETTTISAAETNAWVLQFERERDRYARLGAEIVRLGLEARRDEYVRAQVDVFAGVLNDPDVGLTPEQRRIIATKLRALGASGQRPTIDGQLTRG